MSVQPTPSLGRHAAECKICSHTQRGEIERDFINWYSPAAITKTYGLKNRASVYRHAHALGLFPKRSRNVRAALEKIIEQAGEVQVNAAAVVSAVTAYARINARGELIERTETVNLNALFERMSVDELERYAKEGILPEWFELHGRTYPHWSILSATSIGIRGKELRDKICGPIVPLHEDPAYSRRTDASGEFQHCFYREPRAGDLLRWEHVRVMYGPEMRASELLPQIEAWHRQLPDLPCPIKVLDGYVLKRARDGSWFEDDSPTWFDHWDKVENEANAAREDANLQLASDSVVLGVTFLGVVSGKHRCRPATDGELRQPETDEFFREIWCTEPQSAAPPGRVWLRNRKNGFYGTVAVEDTPGRGLQLRKTL